MNQVMLDEEIVNRMIEEAVTKRTWVGLTDEEKQEAYFKIDLWRECIDFIEAKLKEKNS